MKRSPGTLTPYLASALRLGGPLCEQAFLAREERALFRGEAAEDARAVRNVRSSEPDTPDPAPFALRLKRRAA